MAECFCRSKNSIYETLFKCVQRWLSVSELVLLGLGGFRISRIKLLILIVWLCGLIVVSV